MLLVGNRPPAGAHVTLRRSRIVADIAIAAAGLCLFASIALLSGRIEEAGGLGYDGEVYGRMIVKGLDTGSANARLRPLVLLINQLANDFVFHDVILTFTVMNVVYLGLLAYVLVRLLGVYGVSTGHKLIVTVNVFTTIAVSQIFAFYPVLVDAGAYFFVALATYAILRGRRAAIVTTTLLASVSREFGLVTVLFGVHRDLRRGIRWPVVLATYAPAAMAFVALRRWVVATQSEALGGTALSIGSVLANVTFAAQPVFLLYFLYFAVTVLGGVSFMLAVAAIARRVRVGGETEWITYIAAIAAMSFLGNADLWRYMAYALPAIVAVYATTYGDRDWRALLPWTVLVTVFTQRPWEQVDVMSYFERWFPVYAALDPDPPSARFWISWSVRIGGLIALAGAAWWAERRGLLQQRDGARDADGAVVVSSD